MTDKTNNMSMDLLLQELQGKQDDPLRVKELFYLCVAKWQWFAVSITLAVGLATLYILCTPPVYTRSAFLLVKEDAKGKAIGSDVASMFADLGLAPANANVNNELLAIRMPSVVKEVVKRLNLDMDYRTGGFLHKETLYGKDLPVRVALLEAGDAESASFTLRLRPGNKVELDDFESTDEKRKEAGDAVTGLLGDTLRTPLGKLIVFPAAGSERGKTGHALLYVSRTNLYDCVKHCTENLDAELSSEDATVIELSYKDASMARAEDVLNAVIAVYNEEWMKDKNQITVSTSQFISDRLEALVRELGDVDADISTYKSEHLLPDVEKASLLFMEQAQESNNKLIALSTQIAVAGDIRSHLTNEKNRHRLLPVNMGLESQDIEGQINEYNTTQLRRNKLVQNGSEQNPLVVDLDHSLAAMRNAIISSIDNLMASLKTQRKEILHDKRNTSAKIAASPQQSKYLQSVGRQQKVKEALYLFMLQKREENELSQAFTPYNMRILTPPSGNLEPVAPQKKRIMAVALLLGLIFPAAFICVRENLNTTVRGRKDLERLTVPFAGEIPLHASGKRRSVFRKSGTDRRQIVVEAGNRDILNEAFRVLRTNIEFMSAEQPEVILLTSFNPGSGKTFLTMNIAASLAVKGKHVLVIDGDLRHGSLSSYIGTYGAGLSDWLARLTDNMHETVRHVSDQYPGLDIIPVGTIPPNPTELLSGERLGELVAAMRTEYDYILIDCPPVDIVADTQILERQADRTLFVARAGLLERSMLPELDKAYKEQKYKNMSVVLNGTVAGNHRYGYGYGYSYGYGYGDRKK